MKIEDELKIIQARLDKIMAPTPEPKNSLGHTAAQKEKLAMDWITRPSTKPIRKAMAHNINAKKDWKYESWNGKTKPDSEPLMTYIDRIERDFGNKK